ncbi:uncharacterized protein LOC116012576 isoform X2 [Ipomoea triloba]|uniref:uncharacterized protein LOC116012576 isoform X2 n=1 Tax=Ipomoea triloba TaxID=35885 RepID=UPI00125D846A|nr:uncharacterized protein LOC116012576 isoform X2 [Ipomoea triloba]
MELPCETEVPPILQLKKWDPSEYQLELSKFREGFLSPTREILLLLSYHCEALLLPLAREKSIKYPENCNYGNSKDSTPLTSRMPTFAVPCSEELGDDIPSTSKSIEMDGIHTLESDTRKSNNYPFIHDVNSLTWGICEDSYSQYEDKPFRELLFVVGNHGVTVHAFSQSFTYKEEMGSTSENDTGQGSWVEWGPGPPATLSQELDGQQESGWHYDASFNVFDISRNSAAEGRPYSICTKVTNDLPFENISEKRWLRTLLTKVETLKSDEVVYTRFPENSLFDPSAMAVSFRLFHNDSLLLDFLSHGCSSSQEKENTNLSILDPQNSTSADSMPINVGCYRCLRVFSNGSQCLIGFALTLTEFVPHTNERKNSKILVAVAKLLSWGLKWVFTVALDENVERHAAAEWTDFRFSCALLICLNASGLIYFYDAKNGLYVACLDLLHICGDLSVKIDGNCVEDKDYIQLHNKAHNRVCQSRFERLFVMLNALTLVVIDKHGVSYVIQASDYIPRKYHQLENLLPYYEDIGLGPLAAWDVGAADIGYQRDISGEGNTVTKKSSFTSSAWNKGVKRSPESNFKEPIVKNWCEFLGCKLPSGLMRKYFLPIYKFHEDDVICLSPFGITRLLKGRNSQDKSKCRLVHSSLQVDLSLNDDNNYNVQGWEAIVNEAIGFTFQGCLYLVTENGISVVLPSLSISSNFYPIEAIGYRQSGYLYGLECDFDTFAKIERVKKPLSSWKVEILDKVLLYEGPEQADQLCLENGWDLSLPRIRCLQLALDYLKFEEIENSLEMLAGANLAEEGIMRLLFASVYLMFHKVGNDSEVSAASRLLALATGFATKMIRTYGLSLHKRDNPKSWNDQNALATLHTLEQIDMNSEKMENSRKIQKMAHFLEIIRSLQWQLNSKFKRPGQGLADRDGLLSDMEFSLEDSKILDLSRDVLPFDGSNQRESAVPAVELESTNDENLALMPVDSLDSKTHLALENPKDMIARWESDNLDLKTIVKDALLSGRLPLAVLKLHLHRLQDLPEQESHDTFSEVREVGKAIAYDLFLKGETGIAVATLQKLGEDIETSLKQLAFGTVRRSLRLQIVDLMKRYGYLGPHEWKTLEMIALIERVYPCRSFLGTFCSRQQKINGEFNGNVPEEINLQILHPLAKDLVIVCGELDGVVLGPWTNIAEYTSHCETDDDSTHTSYWTAAAVWSGAWDQRIVDCIVLDQQFLLGVNVSWESQLEYHIRHNDWLQVSRVLEVIPSYALSHGNLGVNLESSRSAPVVEYPHEPEAPDSGNYAYFLEELDSVCLNVPDVQILRFPAHIICSMWLRVLMEQQLAKEYIFLKDYWGSVEEMVNLLARSGFIIDTHDSPVLEEGSFEKFSDSLLSTNDSRSQSNTIQALHKLIVYYCAQHNLPNFLDLYLDHHKLGMDDEALSLLENAAGDNQWVRWLLLQRVKGKEFEASFSNACAVASRGVAPGNNLTVMEVQDIIHTVDDIAEGGWEMAALATLMYSPIPIQDCLSSGSVSRHHNSAQCTLENLRPALQCFPTLWRALVAACFGQDPTCNVQGSRLKFFACSDLLDYLTWREDVFFSSGRDASILQMLPCWFPKAVRRLIQLYIQGPLGWQSFTDLPMYETFLPRDVDHAAISPMSWEIAIQKHIEEELYDSSLKESGRGIEHHLHRGRALAALNNLLAVRAQKLKSESAQRGRPGTSSHAQSQTIIQSDMQTLLGPITETEQLLLSSVIPLAILHFKDSVLVASCAFLLELCGLPAATIQIDVAALRRIASFHKSGDYADHYRQLNTRSSSFHSTIDGDVSESLARALADYYRHHDCLGCGSQKDNQSSITSRHQSQALMLVLQHLEKASLPLVTEGVTCGSWLMTGNGDGVELRSQQKAVSQHWNLVIAFCHAHHIPLSTKYLAVLAKDNDWVGFLSESQIGGYPSETVIHVASEEFSNPRLKTHILTVLRSMQARKKVSSTSSLDTAEKEGKTSFSKENLYAPTELFGIIADCENQKSPGQVLLQKAKNLCWSLLAIIASCFPDVSPLSCLTVWLEITAARETSAIKVNNIASQIANNVGAAVEATNSLPASARAPTVHYNRRNSKRRRLMDPMSIDSLTFRAPEVSSPSSGVSARGIITEDAMDKQVAQDEKVSIDSTEVFASLSRMVAVLCEKNLFLPLLRAFEMFLPSCSLLPFIRALQAFSQMRLSEASAHLGSFSARIKEEPHVQANMWKEGQAGSSWICSTAVKAADAMLLKCASPYEKRCLLQLLAATEFGDGGSAAASYRRLFWKINLAEPSLQKDDSLHLANESLDDASLLIALEKHGYWEHARSWARQLETSVGSWKSAVHHVTEMQAESMVAEWKEFLWDVQEERVALWGHCQTLFIRNSFPPLQAGLFFLKHAEEAEKDLPTRELHELLLLSLQWLSGMITQSNPVYPLNLLREIETRAWLLAVESESQVKSEGEITSKSCNREITTSKSSNIVEHTATIITKMDNHINHLRSKIVERTDARDINQTQLRTPQVLDSTSGAKAKRRTKSFVPSRKPFADALEKGSESEGLFQFNLKDDTQLVDENFKVESFSRWQERVEPLELERAILSLLEFGQITAARQLQQKLSPDNMPSEFTIVDTALKLAAFSTPNQNVLTSVLDDGVRFIMHSYNLLHDQHIIDPLQVLESLAVVPAEGRGRGLCRRVIAVVKSANVLGLSFSEAFDKQPIEILQLLALKAQDSFEEADVLVQTHPMPAASIAQILAESFLKGLLAAHRGGYMDSQKEEGPAPLLWRFSDFLKWAELCPSEPEVGHALMRLVITGQEIPHACEVELLILSHHFYKSSACLDGVDVLVALAATRVEAYVSEGDFPCLARLITGVGNFYSLNFILGILIENGQLDLLLQKFSAAVDANAGFAEAVRGFRMAVLTSLKQFNPNDLDAFAMVYNHFDMKHETASLLMSRAEHSSQQWFFRYDKDQTDDLLASMRYYIEAAEVYSSIDAGNKTCGACAQASLLSLQIRMPDLHWLSLSETNARRVLVEQSRFLEALIVAEAYNLNQPGEWALVIWNQMLRPELIEQFIAEFVAVLPLQPSMLLELARFYRAEVAARGDQSQFSVWLMTGGGLPAEWAKYLGKSFRCLLKRTRDLRLQLQLASIATGFVDVIDGCNRALDKVPENAGPLVLRKGHGGGYLPLM